jgi:hypothetical protein
MRRLRDNRASSRRIAEGSAPTRRGITIRLRLPTIFVAALLGAAVSACGPAQESVPDQASAPAVEPGIDPATVETRTPLVKNVLVLALDGATWKLMDPLLDAGRLPNLAALIARGARAELTTLEPTVSPAIWTTIATGFLPDRHGILGFDGVPGMTMKTLPNATMRRVKTYWEILSDFGRTSATFGWWATWPAGDLGAGSCLVSDRVPYTRMEAAVNRASLSTDAFPNSPGGSVLIRGSTPLFGSPGTTYGSIGFGTAPK